MVTKTNNRREMRTLTDHDWQQFARDCARDARENHANHQRGIWYFQDLDVVVLFNNQGDGMQDQEVTRLRSLLQNDGIEELGYAIHAESGEARGPTWAIVLKPTWGQMSLVEQLVRRLGHAEG